MKRILLTAAIALALQACENAPANPAISIPYKKVQLDNGLTVVLHQDNSDPLVHVDVTYHVGSGREDIGKSGFAHFFEHMMFQGSENVGDEQHFKIVSEAGGNLNGTTNSDRTNYYETVPDNQLEKMLWLEADRMGYFLDAVTEKKFEVQRETVKNERGQNYDNRPYGRLFERVGEALYPEGHPYSWSTIGYIEDLNRATVMDLKKFFMRWYGPNNATLTIGGNFDEAQTLDWIEKYFGPIPAGPQVDAPVYTPVTLDKDRYISMEDNVAIPLIYMAWPTVHVNHADEAPLDVLMSILGDGKTSLLYKNLDKDGLTVQSGAGHACRELGCEFTLFALPNPKKGQSLADIEAILRSSLDEFETRGVEDDDLTRVKASIVSGMIYGLESVSGKVTQLAYYETFRNSPDGIGDDISRYEGVSKNDVMRVYKKYIKDSPAVIMSIVPEGQKDLIASADTWSRPQRNIPTAPAVETVNWSPPEDDFDRSVMPPAGPNPVIKVPPVYRADIGNHIKLLGARNPEVPTSTVSIRIKTGQKDEPLDKLGLAGLTAAMLDEATMHSAAEDLSNRLNKLGSSVSISSGDNFTTMRLRSLSENIGETVDIAVEKLFAPAFDPDDFARIQANAIQNIHSSQKNASYVASNLFSEMIYGEDNAFAHNNDGKLETLQSITLDDVKQFYADYYSAAIMDVIAVSDLDKGAMLKALKPLADMKAGEVTPAALKAFPKLAGGTLYFIDKPGAAQSEIRIGKRALPYDATGEYYKASMMNYPLGGAFNSRINLNLREDKGYTYGARSFFSGSENYGYFRAGAGVKKDASAASVNEFIKEIKAYYSEGIKESELEFTKSAVGQGDALSYETPSKKLGFLSRMMTYDLEPSFVDTQSQILQDLTKAEVDALAKALLNVDDMIIIMVGDKAAVFEDVKALGYPIVELDADGQPVKP